MLARVLIGLTFASVVAGCSGGGGGGSSSTSTSTSTETSVSGPSVSGVIQTTAQATAAQSTESATPAVAPPAATSPIVVASGKITPTAASPAASSPVIDSPAAIATVATLPATASTSAIASAVGSRDAVSNGVVTPSSKTLSTVGSTESPTLAGTPVGAIVVGRTYAFQPTVMNTSGTVTFSILNCPSWASFNVATGELSGTPDAADVGTYSKISISVNDGAQSASLKAFAIIVTSSALGSAEVNWVPPTENTDGSAIADLAGYRIYYGTSSASLTQNVDVKGSHVSSQVVSDLSQGTWYFEVRAYTTSNVESSASTVATKTIL